MGNQYSYDLNIAFVSEVILKNTSARCVCPKSCDVTRYKVSTSYASVNQDIDSKFSLSSEFQTRLGKKLNKSLDTREWVVPERRQANIDDTEKLLDGLSYMEYSPSDRYEDTIVKMVMSGIMGDITTRCQDRQKTPIVGS